MVEPGEVLAAGRAQGVGPSCPRDWRGQGVPFPALTIGYGRALLLLLLLLLRQRFFELRLQHRLKILRRDRPHQLVGDLAFAIDQEGFRHAVDTPVDRGAALLVGAGGAERIAEAVEEAP